MTDKSDTSVSFSKKRKDPKQMSVEELDEYISRNRKEGFTKNSLNNSVNSINSNHSNNKFYTNKEKLLNINSTTNIKSAITSNRNEIDRDSPFNFQATTNSNQNPFKNNTKDSKQLLLLLKV